VFFERGHLSTESTNSLLSNDRNSWHGIQLRKTVDGTLCFQFFDLHLSS
jgi:hypothetical protein